MNIMNCIKKIFMVGMIIISAGNVDIQSTCTGTGQWECAWDPAECWSVYGNACCSSNDGSCQLINGSVCTGMPQGACCSNGTDNMYCASYLGGPSYDIFDIGQASTNWSGITIDIYDLSTLSSYVNGFIQWGYLCTDSSQCAPGLWCWAQGSSPYDPTTGVDYAVCAGCLNDSECGADHYCAINYYFNSDGTWAGDINTIITACDIPQTGGLSTWSYTINSTTNSTTLISGSYPTAPSSPVVTQAQMDPHIATGSNFSAGNYGICSPCATGACWGSNAYGTGTTATEGLNGTCCSDYGNAWYGATAYCYSNDSTIAIVGQSGTCMPVSPTTNAQLGTAGTNYYMGDLNEQTCWGQAGTTQGSCVPGLVCLVDESGYMIPAGYGQAGTCYVNNASYYGTYGSCTAGGFTCVGEAGNVQASCCSGSSCAVSTTTNSQQTYISAYATNGEVGWCVGNTSSDSTNSPCTYLVNGVQVGFGGEQGSCPSGMTCMYTWGSDLAVTYKNASASTIQYDSYETPLLMSDGLTEANGICFNLTDPIYGNTGSYGQQCYGNGGGGTCGEGACFTYSTSGVSSTVYAATDAFGICNG